MMKPKRCYGPDKAHITHAAGCHLGRPLCRWQRALNARRRVCWCGAYPWPHRVGSGPCGRADGMPAVLVRDLSDDDRA